jgi:hypothetical protein
MRNRRPQEALETLDGRIDSREAVACPDYVAASTAILLEIGDFERAELVFRQWPQPWAGYEYWRLNGIIEQESRLDHSAAAESYRRALDEWPGPSDWSTMRRLAHCLTREGRIDEAEMERARSQRVEALMEPEVFEPVREALQDLDRPDDLQVVVEFYRELGRTREVQEWTAAIDALR